MAHDADSAISARSYVDWYIDTSSAWAAFEREVRNAQRSVQIGFKRFDVTAPLADPSAGDEGALWSDLLHATLARGVNITLDLAAATAQPEEIALIEAIAAEHSPGRNRSGRLSFRLLAHPARMATGLGRVLPLTVGHRHNVAIVDGSTTYLSRLGLLKGRTREAARDLSLIARGPVTGEAMRFLNGLNEFCSGRADPPPARRFLRTISRPARRFARLLSPETVCHEFETAQIMLTRRAERLIYIETHSLDSPEVTRALVERARAVSDLRLILVRPTAQQAPPGSRIAASIYLRQKRCLDDLAEAFGPRMFHGIALSGCSNVSIFDDEAAITGSPDLGVDSLRRDTGAGIYLRRTDGIETLRLQMMRHWLPDLGPDAFRDPAALTERWQETALRNLHDGRRGRHAILPAVAS